MYFSKVAHLISLSFSFTRKKAINRRPICPQCRQEIDIKISKTIYLSSDRRHCCECTTSQAYADGLKKQLEEKDKQLIEMASKYSESQELITRKNESLSESEKYSIIKTNLLLGKHQTILRLEREMLKIKETLEKNDNQLTATKTINSELQQLMAQKDKGVCELERILIDTENQLAKQQQSIDSLNNEISKITVSLKEKDELLKEKANLITRNNGILVQENISLSQSEDVLIVERIQKKIDKLKEMFDLKVNLLENKNILIKNLRKMLNEKDKQLTETKKTNSELEQLVTQKDESLCKMRLDFDFRGDRLAQMQKSTDFLNNEISKFKALLNEKDELLKEKANLINRNIEMISGMQIKSNEKDEKFDLIYSGLEALVVKFESEERSHRKRKSTEAADLSKTEKCRK